MKKYLILTLLFSSFIAQADPCHFSHPHVLLENNSNLPFYFSFGLKAWYYNLTSTPCVEGTGFKYQAYGYIVQPNSSHKIYLNETSYNPFELYSVTAYYDTSLDNVWNGSMQIWACSNNCPNNLKWSAIKLKIKGDYTLEVVQRN